MDSRTWPKARRQHDGLIPASNMTCLSPSPAANRVQTLSCTTNANSSRHEIKTSRIISSKFLPRRTVTVLSENQMWRPQRHLEAGDHRLTKITKNHQIGKLSCAARENTLNEKQALPMNGTHLNTTKPAVSTPLWGQERSCCGRGLLRQGVSRTEMVAVKAALDTRTCSFSCPPKPTKSEQKCASGLGWADGKAHLQRKACPWQQERRSGWVTSRHANRLGHRNL